MFNTFLGKLPENVLLQIFLDFSEDLKNWRRLCFGKFVPCETLSVIGGERWGAPAVGLLIENCFAGEKGCEIAESSHVMRLIYMKVDKGFDRNSGDFSTFCLVRIVCWILFLGVRK